MKQYEITYADEEAYMSVILYAESEADARDRFAILYDCPVLKLEQLTF